MTMKKIFPWLIASAAILLALPWLAVTFVESDAGMAVSLFLFFVLNPIYAICTGAYAGKDIKILGIAGHHRTVLFSRSMVVP